MPEYLTFRCCMCPNTNSPQNTVCPESRHKGGPKIKLKTSCRFVKTYIDDQGAFVSVVSGKPDGKTWFTGRRWTINGIGFSQRLEPDILPDRENFDRAQADLNAYAKSNKWSELVVDVGGDQAS